jgi:methanesulfonate monooxygenase small subunit
MKAAYQELVYRAALALDAADYAGFLAVCAPEFHYTIAAYSPEIRRQMTWLEHDKAGLENLFETLPRHNSDRAPLSRHVTVYTVDLEPGGEEAKMVSVLQVFQTRLDGGASGLLAVGKIYDRARLISGAALLVQRRIQLDTRPLGIGTHIPL